MATGPTPSALEKKFAELRKPFAPSQVGKLPRITCGACRDARSKNCDRHSKKECAQCHNWITTAHMHLDYVGHAAVTDRLLAVDPKWSWEPVAWDAGGLPATDQSGGLWIRLTVLDVSRLGYGNAEGKCGGDAVKEIIGDALRNAAMRFGVALDLWSKNDLNAEGPQPEPEPAAQSGRQANAQAARPESQPQQQNGQAPQGQPSGRNWSAEADEVASATSVPAGQRADQLLAMFNECAAFNEMTPNIQRKYTALGKALRTQAEKDAEKAKAANASSGADEAQAS